MWIKWFSCTALLLLFVVVDAQAQGCCASGSSLTPTRLDLHERALVGVQLGASGMHGSHTADGRYRGAPRGSTDVELRQTLFATSAIGSRFQASVLIPWLETYRRASTSAGEWGHGIGDVSVSLRADVLQLHEYPDVPAVAVLLGGLFPTGTEAESTRLPLGSDATGGGVYRASAGVGVEQAFGSWLASLTATVSLASTTTRAGLSTRHAPRWSIVGSASYAWSHHLSTAGSLTFETEGNTTIDGVVANDSNKRRTELSLITTYSFDDAWRAQARLSADPPVLALGANESARVSGNLAVIWGFL